MKATGVLFVPEMAMAIKEGKKTQTRRIIKPQPDARGLRTTNVSFEDYHGREVKFPYGNVGDFLYIKEPHYRYGKWEKNGFTKKGKQRWRFKGDKGFNPEVLYLDNPPAVIQKNTDRVTGWYKRSPLFMEQRHARTWMQILSRYPERLHDISNKDIRREGAAEYGCTTHFLNWQMLWQAINGDQSWNDNPWVWVITFAVVPKPTQP